MKIGDKKEIKKGNFTFTMERIKFDWKSFIAMLIFIGLVIYFVKK